VTDTVTSITPTFAEPTEAVDIPAPQDEPIDQDAEEDAEEIDGEEQEYQEEDEDGDVQQGEDAAIASPTAYSHALTTVVVIAFDWATTHGYEDGHMANDVWAAAKLLRPDLEPGHVPAWRRHQDSIEAARQRELEVAAEHAAESESDARQLA
jgi:hypothetical protein